MKTQLLEAIGASELRHPAEVNAALGANDRIKYYLTLLQMAASRAENPNQPIATLRRERLACGIDDPVLDDLVAASRREDGHYRLPGWVHIRERITQDLRVMATPVLSKRDCPGPRGTFSDRLESLLDRLPTGKDDLIDANVISAMTCAGRGAEDSIHQIVMDLHKVLNAIQNELAQEHLDGAAVYHIDDADRPLIAAFMLGVNRTAPLKFNHPGLGTTVTRSGSKLVMQNDIGTTDAHVIVIHIEGLVVALTYTDVHLERVEFLREMVKPFAVSWERDQTRQTENLASGDAFLLALGRFEAKDRDSLLTYLDFLGSRLVFLIDWNRARKQLRGFLRKAQRFQLLAWAAKEDIGHRGFLEVGGPRLIHEAVEETAGSAMHFGDRLCDVLGNEAALDFVCFVFRSATQALRAHQSSGLLRDRIRAELQIHFSSEGKRLLELAGEHAGIIFDIATLVRDGIRGTGARIDPDGYAKLAKRARGYEHEADQLVMTSREAVRRRPEYTALFRIVESADDAADELEEVAFLLELLMNSHPDGSALSALGTLADLLVDATQEWIKAVSHAIHVDPGRGAGAHEDTSDFLTAVDGVLELEHRADDAERALTHAAIQQADDFRQLHLYTAMAHSLEAAADALKWASLTTRDYVLGKVLGA